MVSTQDSESCDPSSNLGGTLTFTFAIFNFQDVFVAPVKSCTAAKWRGRSPDESLTSVFAPLRNKILTFPAAPDRHATCRALAPLALTVIAHLQVDVWAVLNQGVDYVCVSTSCKDIKDLISELKSYQKFSWQQTRWGSVQRREASAVERVGVCVTSEQVRALARRREARSQMEGSLLRPVPCVHVAPGLQKDLQKGNASVTHMKPSAASVCTVLWWRHCWPGTDMPNAVLYLPSSLRPWHSGQRSRWGLPSLLRTGSDCRLCDCAACERRMTSRGSGGECGTCANPGRGWTRQQSACTSSFS